VVEFKIDQEGVLRIVIIFLIYLIESCQ
jgi:hypothetical protein